MKNTTEIHPLYSESILKCIEIGNTQFGNGFVTEFELEDTIKSTQRFGLVSKTDNIVSGFVLAVVCDSFNELEPILVSNINWFKKTYKDKYPIALIQTIGVSENYTGLGIGKKLTKAIINDLNQLSKTTLSLVWEHKNGTPLAHILGQCGLSIQVKIPDYWQEDSVHHNYECKYCGTPPCQCAMMVYSN